MERNFIIFNVSELTNINFKEVLETSANTVRKSVDGQKTFVKWEGEIPECVANLTTKEGPYTNSEMLDILPGENWLRTINFQS
jgi:hypothetical protein